MQIILCDVNYTGFRFDSKINHISSKMYKNGDFWQRNYPKAEQFCSEFLLAEMLASFFFKKQNCKT